MKNIRYNIIIIIYLERKVINNQLKTWKYKPFGLSVLQNKIWILFMPHDYVIS